MSTADTIERLRAAALQQPGARERASGIVKFQCPACAEEGHDEHRDNAGLFLRDGTWGCAFASGNPTLGRAHWEAIGRALGTFASNGAPRAERKTDSAPANENETAPLGIGLGAFLARDFPPTTSYIEGIMSDDGGGWIAGEEKLGKTLYAMAEGLALSTGEQLAGLFKIPEPRRVLFLEEEDSPRRAHRRLRALIRGLGYDPEEPAIRETLDHQFLIDVWGGFSLDSPLMMQRLEGTIDAFRPHVVYIDVLRKVTIRALKDEVQMGAILAALDDLRRRYGVIFRIVHHYRKVQGFRTGRGSQEIGGSFVLGAWAENSVYLEPIGRKQGAVRFSVQCLGGHPKSGHRWTGQNRPKERALKAECVVARS